MQTLRIARFFLVTVLFSLKSNASYAIILPLVCLVQFTGDIDKHMILASMLALSVSPLFCGGTLFRMRGDARGQWLWPFLLPLEPRVLVRGMAVAAVVYAVVTQGLLTFFLDRATYVPSNADLSSADSCGVRFLRFRGYDRAGDSWEFAEQLLPSLVFGTVGRDSRFTVFPGWEALLPVFFGLVTLYAALQWCLLSMLRQRRDTFVNHGRTALWVVAALLGAVIAADMLLAPCPILHLRAAIDTSPAVLTACVGALILAAGAGCVHAVAKRRFLP